MFIKYELKNIEKDQKSAPNFIKTPTRERKFRDVIIHLFT